MVAALLLMGSGVGIGVGLARSGIPGTPFKGSASLQPLPRSGSATTPSGGALDAQAIAAKVDPAVVDINTTDESAAGTGQAAGTGMLISSSGLVLTNNHVVEGATSISVTIAGHGSHPARVVGVDPTADIAVIKVEGVSGLPKVKLGNSSSLTVSEPVVAIGNALGRGGTPVATSGTITALNQSVTASNGPGGPEHLTGMIQTDASIISGDSGGPLVDRAGQVVGMITAGSVQGLREAPSSVGFAVPINTATRIADEIRSGQPNSNIIIGLPGFLGVSVEDLQPGMANQLGVNVTSGALVVQVVPGSAAAAAGIPRFGVITSIDGASITSADSLGQAIHQHKPGQQIQVVWVDGSGSHTATVTLTSGPAA